MSASCTVVTYGKSSATSEVCRPHGLSAPESSRKHRWSCQSRHYFTTTDPAVHPTVEALPPTRITAKCGPGVTEGLGGTTVVEPVVLRVRVGEGVDSSVRPSGTRTAPQPETLPAPVRHAPRHRDTGVHRPLGDEEGHVMVAVASHLVQVPVLIAGEDVRPLVRVRPGSRAALFVNLTDLRTDHCKDRYRHGVDGLFTRCSTKVLLK